MCTTANFFLAQWQQTASLPKVLLLWKERYRKKPRKRIQKKKEKSHKIRWQKWCKNMASGWFCWAFVQLLFDYYLDCSGLLQSFCWAEPIIIIIIICIAPINKAFIAAFVLRTVRNHYIIKNIELIILSNQWTPLDDNFCRLVS